MPNATFRILPKVSSSAFANFTQRLQITPLNLSHFGPEMLGPTTMAIGAGPLYTNAVMGQAPSATERENARKASSTILRRDCIHIEESENFSRPESWSMHFDCTNQAPYSTKEDDEMMTQTSLLHLPPENPSHDLAFFLRTTGPTAPHRRPSKLERPQRAASGPKNAFRFPKIRQRRLNTPVATAHERFVTFDALPTLSIA